MAIKAGQILHVGNTFLVDRIQTGGPGGLNIPEETIYELGNYKSVGIERDRPDLTFDVETLDMTTELEAILHGVDPTTVVDGAEFTWDNCVPLDVISPYKGAAGSFATVRGVSLPHLVLENVTYRGGVRQNATESFTLRGDSIQYVPGTPYMAVYAVALGTEVGPYAFANAPALAYSVSGTDRYALSVELLRADGTVKRLFRGTDYTDDATGVTLTVAAGATDGDQVRIVYGSATPATYAQAGHPTSTLKPAALRHRSVDVYIGPQGGTLERWEGLQGVEVTRRVNLEADEELGNPNVVSQDYDVPEVSGNLTMKPATVEYMFDRIAEVTNVAANKVADVLTYGILEMEVRFSNPTTGARLKTVVVPDVIIQPPAPQGRVQQKLEVTLPLKSESGSMSTFAGAPA